MILRTHHRHTVLSICRPRPVRTTALLALTLALLTACIDKPTADDTSAAEATAATAAAATSGLSTRVIEFKNKLQQDPFSADARFGLGAALLELGNPRAAEAEFTRALELGFDKDLVLPPLARTWNLLGRSKELIEAHAGTQLSNAAASAELKSALAWAYVHRGDAKTARAMVDSALKDDPKSPRALVLNANIAMSDGKVDEALRSLEQTLAEHPQSSEAWELKGDVLLMVKGQMAAAVAAYEQALRVDPQHLPTHAKLVTTALDNEGVVAAQARLDKLVAVGPGSLPAQYLSARLKLAKGDVNAARETIQRTLIEYPKDLRSLLLAAEIELRGGTLRTAEEHLATALTLAPAVPRTRHLLAQVYLRSGAPEKAQMIVEPLLRGNRVDATALGLAADAAMQAGQSAAATRLYERAVAAEPGNARFRTSLALARMTKGDLEGGVRDLEAAAASDRTIYSDLALLSARLRMGDLGAALKSAERVALKQPKRPLPQWVLGRLKLRSKSFDDARQHFERALEFDASFLPAVVSLAELDLMANDAAQARRRFERVLAINPNSLDALLGLAEIRARSGEAFKTVASSLETAVRLHPSQPRAWLAWVNHLIRAGDGAAALLAAQSATGALPDNLNVTDALGRAQMAAGESAQALSTFRKIVTARPRAAEPHVRMADVYLARQEVDSAIDSFRLAVALQPDLLSAQVKLAGLATVKKNWPEALKVARNVQRVRPKDATGFHLEGLVYAAQQQWEPALAAFRSAAQRGESSELTVQLHGALSSAGKKDEAARLAKQWLEKSPKDIEVLRYLADLALVDKEYGTADAHYRAILTRSERDADAMNNLAWILNEQAKPGGLALALQATQLRPGRADMLDTLAMSQAREGQLAAALQTQKRAVELAPNTPELRLSLARIAVKVGDVSLARTQLDKLSALGKAFAGQTEVWQLRQQLQQLQ